VTTPTSKTVTAHLLGVRPGGLPAIMGGAF